MSSSSGPKFFYGYIIVAACFVVLYMLWGMVLNTLPIFLVPITEDMGWGRGQFMLALVMGAIGTTLSAPIAGKMIDRIGARSIMSAGAGFFHQAYKTYLPVFYLFVVLMVIGAVISTRIKPPPNRQPVSP